MFRPTKEYRRLLFSLVKLPCSLSLDIRLILARGTHPPRIHKSDGYVRVAHVTKVLEAAGFRVSRPGSKRILYEARRAWCTIFLLARASLAGKLTPRQKLFNEKYATLHANIKIKFLKKCLEISWEFNYRMTREEIGIKGRGERYH